MFGIEQKLEKAARKAAAFSAGGLLAAVGAGFLTAAAYMLISEMRTPLFAVTTLGLIYLGLAAIAFAIGAFRPDEQDRKISAAALPGNLSPMQLMAVSFIQGLEQGRNRRRAR
jgi:hypothetical protein